MLVCCNKHQSEKKTKWVLNLVPGEERVGFRTRNRKDVTFSKISKFHVSNVIQCYYYILFCLAFEIMKPMRIFFKTFITYIKMVEEALLHTFCFTYDQMVTYIYVRTA